MGKVSPKKTPDKVSNPAEHRAGHLTAWPPEFAIP